MRHSLRCLGKFLEMDETANRVWQPEELGALFRRQLSAPLQFDLDGMGARVAAEVKTLAESERAGFRSFGDLLHRPNPPVPLLEITREFAKRSRAAPGGPLPSEVATALYFASIAAALARCGRRISRLTDASLRKGFAWAAALPWLEEPTRALFREGLALLDAEKTTSRERSRP